MKRAILHVTVATVTFILGIATNWTVNTFGGLAVNEIYHDASIPSLLEANPSDVGGTLNGEPASWWRCKANVVNSARE